MHPQLKIKLIYMTLQSTPSFYPFYIRYEIFVRFFKLTIFQPRLKLKTPHIPELPFIYYFSNYNTSFCLVIVTVITITCVFYCLVYFSQNVSLCTQQKFAQYTMQS